MGIDHRNRRGIAVVRGIVASPWRLIVTMALIVALLATVPWVSTLPGARAQELIIAPPAAPGLSLPEDGATVAETPGITLQWQAVTGALDYQVVINDGARTSPWTSETSWSPGTLPAGVYQWAVRARNEAGTGAPGAIYTFTISDDGIALPNASAAPIDLEPLPLQLQQQGQQGEDGTESASPDPAVAGTDAGPVIVADAAPAGTPAAGTPIPVDAASTNTAPATTDPALSAPADDTAAVVEEADGGEKERKKDKDTAAAENPEAPLSADANVVPASDSDVGNSGERDGGGKNKDKDKKRDKKPREPRDRTRSNGNGGVSEVIAAPPEYSSYAFEMPEILRQAAHQQDATDATAGSVGESGTVNGVPRETADVAPPETIGPGNPGEILLPPSVPGVPGAQLPGIGGTTELAFNATADATVFTASPGSPQSPESINFLAIGGPNGAVSLISFRVEGVGDGTVLGARLTFMGAGGTGAPGGSVGVIYDYIVQDGATANGVPGWATAFNVHGAPAWFERVEPNGMTAVDVTGSVTGDGRITFVLPGQPDATGSLFAMESGNPPQLLLTVALPA